MDPQRSLPGDSTLVENIVNYLKAKGIFDEFRHDCLADVDTKSSCQNLSQRVDGYTSKFLATETWHPDLNKNELRNKLRRHIDESGMLAVGADHVVEQVINPKIPQLFLPKIIEVVHQYMKEQNEMLNKKSETASSDNTLSENISDASDSKAKTSISDPIADILSFSYSKSKPTHASSTYIKNDNVMPKHTDISKDKKKEEKNISPFEKNSLESPNENLTISTSTEAKAQTDKEKIKKEEYEAPAEVPKKVVKEDIKPDKKKVEEVKIQSEINTLVEENKPSVSVPTKPNIPGKKDIDKNKQKPKVAIAHKTSSSSSDVKKPKKDLSDKSSDKHIKSKSVKPSKELSSPTKSISSVKCISKEEKGGEISKTKSSDSSSSKTSESSSKKSSKTGSNKKDGNSSKHKGHGEKVEKYKISKSLDKNEQNYHCESANSEKVIRNIHYSSSYDSSQGSDQEKSSSSSSKKERQKHFSKHAKKESSEKCLDKSGKNSSDKKISKEGGEISSKKPKSEKNCMQDKFRETVMVGEAAKISSRSNSFGSTSSVSSSSNMSKDNLVSNSDEALENSGKDKKKKQVKEKDSCHSSITLPPPPPPPPPSSSLSCELTSSADMSSIEDTQSSSGSENSSSEELCEESSSDSELESPGSVLNTLNKNALNSSTDDINDFYDIFLYSSSSCEFEGYGNSPEMEKNVENVHESDISISTVHTSDLSSYDDELSDDDFTFNDESQSGEKKRLTLKEAQELIKKKAVLHSFKEKNFPTKDNSNNNYVSLDQRCLKRSSLSSDDESYPSEPKRSLRRERKLNPRYTSSEYTSIFSCRKESFITKQSPYVKHQSSNFSPNAELRYRNETVIQKDKLSKKNSVETEMENVHQDDAEKSSKLKSIRHTSGTYEQVKELSDSSLMSSSDEIDSIIEEEKLYNKNDKSAISGSDMLKLQFKFKPQNNSNYSMNPYPVKRKLKVTECPPAKRPCSRSSIDSSSSEFAPNENKPFNSEKYNMLEDKIVRDGDLKGSDLTDGIKRDLFCKQRTNNNGDILGQKDIFPKNSRGKTTNTPEKMTSETESKELSAL